MKNLNVKAMIAKYAFLIVLGLIYSCNQDPSHEQNRSNNKLTGVSGFEYIEYQFVTIDSCEYIFGVDYRQALMTHKGNCKFCKERNN